MANASQRYYQIINDILARIASTQQQNIELAAKAVADNSRPPVSSIGTANLRMGQSSLGLGMGHAAPAGWPTRPRTMPCACALHAEWESPIVCFA